MRPEECIIENFLAPDQRLEGLWEAIIVDKGIKTRLVNHALLSLEIRPRIRFATSSLHGLVLLVGPPGTGKTTLARALPQELSPLVGGKARLIEVNPHGLMSSEHGQSQQLVTSLLTDVIPEMADDGVPTVVVLDEVESMAVARSEASLAANPADVHRATDAVLAALDRLAQRELHLVIVATSNFPSALDTAFHSRADAVIQIDLPDHEATAAILRTTLEGFSDAYTALGDLASSDRLYEVASALNGADGRRIRKVVTEALALRLETVMDPGLLNIDDLLVAARSQMGGVNQ